MKINMRTIFYLVIAVLGVFSLVAQAQQEVVANPDHEAMLRSKDPQLEKNKRLLYDFWRVVVEGGHVELIDNYVSDDYIQHNPNVASGKQALIELFSANGRKPVPIKDRVQSPIVAIVAEGDLISLTQVRTYPDPQDANKTYTTSGLSLFRVRDGKLVEHWDPALKQ